MKQMKVYLEVLMTEFYVILSERKHLTVFKLFVQQKPSVHSDVLSLTKLLSYSLKLRKLEVLYTASLC